MIGLRDALCEKTKSFYNFSRLVSVFITIVLKLIYDLFSII